MPPEIIRIALTPAIVAVCSLASRRWGTSAGGWLLSLPLISGPVSVLLFLEHGSAFASTAAIATVLGLVATAAFCAVYAVLARRFPWWVCLGAGVTVFASVTAALSFVHLALAPAVLLAAAALLVLGTLVGGPETACAIAGTPRWELPARVLLAGAVVLVLTLGAARLGPQLSGLLVPIPVIGGTMAVSVHRRCGSAAARGLLRGAVVGAWGAVAFSVVVALLLGVVAPWLAYVTAAAMAVAVSALTTRVAALVSERSRPMVARLLAYQPRLKARLVHAA
jgi:hypothetical protein